MSENETEILSIDKDLQKENSAEQILVPAAYEEPEKKENIDIQEINAELLKKLEIAYELEARATFKQLSLSFDEQEEALRKAFLSAREEYAQITMSKEDVAAREKAILGAEAAQAKRLEQLCKSADFIF